MKQGKIHNYLGMDLDWSVGGKVTISMIKYVYKILEDFSEVIKKNSRDTSKSILVSSASGEIGRTTTRGTGSSIPPRGGTAIIPLAARTQRHTTASIIYDQKSEKKPDRDDWGNY